MFFVALEISNMSCVFQTITNVMLVRQLRPVSALLTYRLIVARVFVSPGARLDFIFFGALRTNRRAVAADNVKRLSAYQTNLFASIALRFAADFSVLLFTHHKIPFIVSASITSDSNFKPAPRTTSSDLLNSKSRRS